MAKDVFPVQGRAGRHTKKASGNPEPLPFPRTSCITTHSLECSTKGLALLSRNDQGRVHSDLATEGAAGPAGEDVQQCRLARRRWAHNAREGVESEPDIGSGGTDSGQEREPNNTNRVGRKQ